MVALSIEEILTQAEALVSQAQISMDESRRKNQLVTAETIVLINNIRTLLDSIRDISIYRDYLAKIPQRKIATDYNLSPGRISQIIRIKKNEL
jgi:hypothetical protein